MKDWEIRKGIRGKGALCADLGMWDQGCGAILRRCEKTYQHD